MLIENLVKDQNFSYLRLWFYENPHALAVSWVKGTTPRPICTTPTVALAVFITLALTR